MASKLFWKPFATVPVAPIITGITTHVSCYTFAAPPYKNSCILVSFLLPLDISVCWYCHIHQYACFLVFVFNYYIWPILTTGWTVRDRVPWRRDFPPVQTGPGDHPAPCTMGTGSFPGLKWGRGVLLTTHPLLVPRSQPGL